MNHEPEMQSFYDIAKKAVPEPGIKQAEVEDLLRDASVFLEGPLEYFRQATTQLLEGALVGKNTYHESLSDFDFFKRIAAVLEHNPQ